MTNKKPVKEEKEIEENPLEREYKERGEKLIKNAHLFVKVESPTKIGGELHHNLDKTLHRKLTIKEYLKVIQLISSLLSSERKRVHELLLLVSEKRQEGVSFKNWDDWCNGYNKAIQDITHLLDSDE